jgi:TonB family protein
MAFRALLFSTNPETNSALTAACKSAGIRVEVCTDIFAAIEKGTKQPFSCVLADWSNQPEAGFLLKRARESACNAQILAIAIVDHDPTATEMRDNRVNLLIYRPIFPGEAQQVLAKAAETMQSVSAKDIPDSPEVSEQAPDNTFSGGAESAGPAEEHPQYGTAPQSGESSPQHAEETEHAEDFETSGDEHFSRTSSFSLRHACAAVLGLAALFFLWNARGTVVYLAQTREGRIKVLKESVAALFYLTPSGATPASAAGTEARQDAYFSRGPASTDGDPSKIGVVSTRAEINESHVEVPKPADFPLPAPVYQPAPPPPVHVERAAVPDSLRGAAPITRPVAVSVAPGQMMPVSMPPAPSLPQEFSEPVSLSEDAARALLVHSVDPAYPPEAVAQKLHGSVVLQATIGRNGSVEDLKIVRGQFLLCKSAIAAVKQWRFQPYVMSGHAAQTQTTITINFSAPSN